MFVFGSVHRIWPASPPSSSRSCRRVTTGVLKDDEKELSRLTVRDEALLERVGTRVGARLDAPLPEIKDSEEAVSSRLLFRGEDMSYCLLDCWLIRGARSVANPCRTRNA